jgi:flagellar biosynthesis protein FlhF
VRVRRFVGDTVAETMGKVKRELGSEAVILQTREFREGGFLGFFGKTKVEITAAIEETPVSAATAKYQGSFVEEKKTSQDKIDPRSTEHTAALEEEIKSMRLILEKMNKYMEGLEEEKCVFPPPLLRWANYLEERGINERLINRLLRQVQQTLPEEEWGDNTKIFKRLEENVRQMCSQTGSIQPGIDKPRIVALIGPTGVGKTTTIGKLAAGFSIIDKRKVALITADTYRVAAVEQLKTFGEIIGVPVEVVMTPVGLREALDLHADKELIFIDTAGRSPHHELHMSELCSFLDQAKPDFTMLVMSAATQYSDQLQIYRRFEDLTTHLIFTKLDETSGAGAIINLLGQTTRPPAYLTNGQNVPDDIEVATPERLMYYVLGEGLSHG